MLLGLGLFTCLAFCVLHKTLPPAELLPGLELTVAGVSTNGPTISWPSTTRRCALLLGVLWKIGGGFRLITVCFSEPEGGLYERKRE